METYELKIDTFELGKLEGFLKMMKKFKTVTNRTKTTTPPRRIRYLRNLLRGENLWESDELASQVKVMTKYHLNFINAGLLVFFINAFTKQKFAMRRAMRKPQDLPIKIFAEQLTELNN